MKNVKFYLITLLALFALTACSSVKNVEEERLPPQEYELEQVPNCAADGPGCKQFNPNL